MTMPRLSLYRPEKGNDYKFIDKNIWEMFQVGGTDVLVHKYIGPGDPLPGASTPTTPVYTGGIPELQIQDLLFLENRDRKYDPDVYILRGVYNISDLDFNLSQFGLFLQNDTVFITFHINDTVEKIGRKLLAGDVIELPHLKDYNALNDLKFALKRFYVIEEVSRAAEGFSATWYPHLYRAKCTPLVDSQEFKQILDGLADDTGEDTNTTLRDIMSTYETEMRITEAVLDQAESDAPKSGYDTTMYYTVPLDEQGNVKLVTTDDSDIEASNESTAVDASVIIATPTKDGYQNYHEDGATKRLFRFNGKRWVKYEDNVRMTMSNLGTSDTESGERFEGRDTRQNQKGTFINNTNERMIDGKLVKEKQSLSKALRPKADE
jgi:hypothetical protein